MKPMNVSFAARFSVGIVYALLGVKSRAPPLIALAGLLDMACGEQVMERLIAAETHRCSDELATERRTAWSRGQSVRRHIAAWDFAPSSAEAEQMR